MFHLPSVGLAFMTMVWVAIAETGYNSVSPLLRGSNQRITSRSLSPHPSSGHPPKKHQGCLVYSDYELSKRWTFPSQAANCSWIHVEGNTDSNGDYSEANGVNGGGEGGSANNGDGDNDSGSDGDSSDGTSGGGNGEDVSNDGDEDSNDAGSGSLNDGDNGESSGGNGVNGGGVSSNDGHGDDNDGDDGSISVGGDSGNDSGCEDGCGDSDGPSEEDDGSGSESESGGDQDDVAHDGNEGEGDTDDGSSGGNEDVPNGGDYDPMNDFDITVVSICLTNVCIVHIIGIY
jgi:hypothetical protein